MIYYLVIFEDSIYVKLNKIKHDKLSRNLLIFYTFKIKQN